MRYQEIVETPQIVPDEDWDLSNRKANSLRAQRLLTYKPEVLEQFTAAQLVRLAGNVGGQYALISTKTGLLEYYVQYEISKRPYLGRCATQVKLWRSRNATVRGLASKVFDQYLLTTFDSIVSDSRQTERGREFWETMISGHSQSKTVGLVVGGEIKVYDPKLNVSDWLTSVNGWGTQPAFQQIRFFISNLKITDNNG